MSKKKSSPKHERYKSEGRLEANKKRVAEREAKKQAKKRSKLENRAFQGKPGSDKFLM